jgi:hypothetical protein
MTSVFPIFQSNGATMERKWQGKTEVLGEKPVSLPLCLSQISHGLTRDRTRAFVVRGRRLTASAMPRSTPKHYMGGTLKIEAGCSFEMSVTGQTTRCHTPEDNNHYCEIPKSRTSNSSPVHYQTGHAKCETSGYVRIILKRGGKQTQCEGTDCSDVVKAMKGLRFQQFEVPAAVFIMNRVFWDVTPCRPRNCFRRFLEAWWLQLQGNWTALPWSWRHYACPKRRYLPVHTA